MEPFDSVWVRATATDPAVCRISAEPAAVTSGLCTPVVRSRTLALADGDSIAYLGRWVFGAVEAAVSQDLAGCELAGQPGPLLEVGEHHGGHRDPGREQLPE